MPFSSDSPPAAQEKAGLQHGSLNFLWQKALVADSRGAYGEITNRGIPNWQNYCEIFVVYTQFTDVSTRCKIEPGGPRVGDPWLRYTLVNRSVTAILLSAVNCSSARNGAIPFKVQEEDGDRGRIFLAQCNFGVSFDRYGRSQKERRRDGRKQRTIKTKTKNNHATDNLYTAHYTDQSKVRHGYPANMSVTVS